VTEGKDIGRDRVKRQQKKHQERGKRQRGRNQCVRHTGRSYRRINGGKETVGMRYGRRDKEGETEGRNIEERYLQRRDRERYKGKIQRE
jgi:hypothetical protein